MYYTMQIIEELKINNCNNETKRIAKELKHYIENLNSLYGIDYLSVHKLSLKVDGETDEIKPFKVRDRDYPENEDITLWDNNSKIMELASKLESANQILFEAYICVTQCSSVAYGATRWELDSRDELKQNVSLRCIELCIDEDSYNIYRFNKDEAGCVNESNGAKDDFEPVKEWCSVNFRVNVETDNNQDFSEEDKKYFTAWADKFVEKYAGYTTNPYNFGIFDGGPYFELVEAPRIRTNQLEEFVENMQEVVDYTRNNDMQIDIYGTFMPSEYAFTVLELKLDKNNKVEFDIFTI